MPIQMTTMTPSEARDSILGGTAPTNLHVEGSLSLNGCTELIELPANLYVDDTFNLNNCARLTEVPPGLYVGGSLYLNNCTGLTNIICAGRDSRGYEFYGVKLWNGWRVIAGCQNLSIAEAREHWGIGSISDRPDCLARVEKIASEVENAQHVRAPREFVR